MRRPGDLGTSLIIVLLMVLLAFGVIYVCLGSIGRSGAVIPRMEPLTATFTADGGEIKAYILIDPDTGVQYIVTDAGGIAPRLGK